jgi:hypothetical protein
MRRRRSQVVAVMLLVAALGVPLLQPLALEAATVDDALVRLSRQILQQSPGVPEVGRIPPLREPALYFPQPPFPRPSPQGTLEAPPSPILSMSRPRFALLRAAAAGCCTAGEGWPPGGVLPWGRGEIGPSSRA